MNYLIKLIMVFVFLSMVNIVNAATITTLFNTGVDGTGSVLPAGTIGDPHYSLIAAPTGSSTDIRIITSANGFPIPPYLGDNSSSRWIVPDNDTQTSRFVGDYTYETTFNLSGFNPDTASITGKWAMDNQGVDIILNGHSLGITNNALVQYKNFSPFTISSGDFIPGINKLDFVIHNADDVPTGRNPTGLRVELTGTASAVPVPAAVWLFGSALSWLGLLSRRREVALIV